jgi:glycosyltransferase involved in cell wall biosynthesis
LPAKKWHWRARASALTISQAIPRDHQFTILFTSSVLSLAELLGLRPDLAQLKKVVYFHENQLCYPVKNVKERDFQFGFNQITSCLAADQVLFNSQYNLSSFLTHIPRFLAMQPDHRPNSAAICDQIKMVSQVCYFPLQLPTRSPTTLVKGDLRLHIVWPHRWEHDKDPDTFCRVLIKLHEDNHDFVLSILGEVFSEVPDIFQEVKVKLKDKIKVFGFVPSKEEYYDLLSTADVVVSTALHEFYGVSMLEAVWLGCYPLVPSRLVYPEIYPVECLYNTEQQLFKRLVKMCGDLTACDSSQLGVRFDELAGEEPLLQLLEVLGDRD